MKKFILIALLTFTISYSQKEFKPGYYISVSGVKTSGYIKDDGFVDNNFFYFKKDLNDNETTVSIDAITELQIENSEKYLSRVVDYDTEVAAGINNSVEPAIGQKRTLLEVVVEGEANFYIAEINGLSFYYIQMSGSDTITYLLYKKNIDRSILLGENTKFKRQLFDNLKCGSDYNYAKFQKLGYYEDDIRKMVNAYNICKSGKTDDMTKKEPKEKIKISVLAGVKKNVTRFDSGYAYSTLDSGGNVSPSVGVELSYLLPFRNKSTELFFRIAYDMIKHETQNQTPIPFTVPSTTLYETLYFKSNLIHFYFGPRYYLSGKRASSIFAQAAFEYVVVSGDEATFTATTVGSNPQTAGVHIDITSTFFFNFGLGYLYKKKYGIEFNADVAGNFVETNSMKFSNKTSSFSLNLKYIF